MSGKKLNTVQKVEALRRGYRFGDGSTHDAGLVDELVQRIKESALIVNSTGLDVHQCDKAREAWEKHNGILQDVARAALAFGITQARWHRTSRKSADTQAESNGERWARWQRMADQIWKKHARWSSSRVAEDISKVTGENSDTIRKRIKKPE